jgi:hypothetical protein
VGIREAHCLTSETINVRGLNFDSPIAADITVTKVIGENENDVGREPSNSLASAENAAENNTRTAVSVTVSFLLIGGFLCY